MKVDTSVLLKNVEKAWVERKSDVELVYPYRQNPQLALLRIWACKLGNYLTAGRTPYAVVLDGSDGWVRDATTVLLNALVNASVVLDKEIVTVDSTLCTELYAALIEYMVEDELGDLLAMYPGSHLH